MTLWNRLEGRPRRDDFDRALKAEVRDALWLLDEAVAGRRVRGSRCGLARVRQDPRAGVAADEVPGGGSGRAKRSQVACRSNRGSSSGGCSGYRDGRKLQLALRAQLGRHWARLLEDAGLLGTYRSQYRTRYSFELPPRDEIPTTSSRTAKLGSSTPPSPGGSSTAASCT